MERNGDEFRAEFFFDLDLCLSVSLPLSETPRRPRSSSALPLRFL